MRADNSTSMVDNEPRSIFTVADLLLSQSLAQVRPAFELVGMIKRHWRHGRKGCVTDNNAFDGPDR